MFSYIEKIIAETNDVRSSQLVSGRSHELKRDLINAILEDSPTKTSGYLTELNFIKEQISNGNHVHMFDHQGEIRADFLINQSIVLELKSLKIGVEFSKLSTGNANIEKQFTKKLIDTLEHATFQVKKTITQLNFLKAHNRSSITAPQNALHSQIHNLASQKGMVYVVLNAKQNPIQDLRHLAQLLLNIGDQVFKSHLDRGVNGIAFEIHTGNKSFVLKNYRNDAGQRIETDTELDMLW